MSAKAWDDREVDIIRYLADLHLSPKQVADVLSMAGFPVREDTSIQNKGYRMGVKWQGDSRRP